MDITLEEAASGIERVIEVNKWKDCSECSGTGSTSGRKTTCPDCQGAGQVRFQQGFFSIARTCSRCGGTGQQVTDPCRACSGEGKVQVPGEISVKVPPGVDSGTRLKMTGEGDAGTHGGPPGDLYIVMQVQEHELFHREGLDVYCEMTLSFGQAALGAELEVPTLDNVAKLKIPSGTQPGAAFRLKGKGMPDLSGRQKGDQVVVVNLSVPRELSTRQKELIRELEHLDDSHEGLTDKIRNIFAGRS